MNGTIHFISAGAGSGKTYRLTQILHERLCSGEVRAEGVIATTFTNKAAAELRARVRSHLLEKSEHGLAGAIGQAAIGTVNSICGSLLLRFAFEAGLSTEQQVLDEKASVLLIGKAIDSVLERDGMADLVALARRLGLAEEWLGQLKSLLDLARQNNMPADAMADCAKANAADMLGHFPATCSQDLSADLSAEIAAVLPQLEAAAAQNPKFVKKTAEYISELRAFSRSLAEGDATWGAWIKLSKAAPESRLAPLVETIGELTGRCAEHVHLHGDLCDYLQRMFALCADVMGAYDALKRDIGVLDFTDQEHLLLQLLDQESVRSVLEDELDLLLVDEFQDTSPIQLALFMKLASMAKEVYWVGDIKQAIYGFRGSDTALMESILASLPALGGSKEILDTSWRSRPSLVSLINAIFVPAFSGSLPATEVRLRAARPEYNARASFANWVLQGSNVQLRAKALAAGVQQLVVSGYLVIDKETGRERLASFRDIAILCKSNDNVSELAAALRQCGVPVSTAQPGLLATPEATLALACLRRLNDQTDTIATAEIISLADCAEPEVWVTQRLKYLEQGGRADLWLEEGESAHPLIEKLASMRAHKTVMTPREALQRVIVQCALPERVLHWGASSEVGRTRLANLQALLDLSATYEDACGATRAPASVSGLLLWLREKAADKQDALAVPGLDAVRVITHHASKGLEWPVVLLMDLDKDVKSRVWSSASAISRHAFSAQAPLANRFIRFWPWPFGSQKKCALADQVAASPEACSLQAAAAEEARRLLYVSMTRARDLMVIVRSEKSLSGDWLDTANAPWLLSDPEAKMLTLPDGGSIDVEFARLEHVPGLLKSQCERKPLYWFSTAATAETRLPRVFNPSKAAAPVCTVTEQESIGERISISPEADMTILGTALHACIAASFTHRASPLSEEEVQGLLSGADQDGVVAAQDVLRQIQAFQDWLKERWPAAAAYAEYPLQMKLSNGQVLDGRIDLLLDVGEGWVLIDHKSAPQGAAYWETLASAHAGQLAAYRDVLEHVSGRPVVGCWLYLPVSAGAVRLEFGAV